MEECRVTRGNRESDYRWKQGLDHSAGISAESSGSEGLSTHLLVLPPSAEAEPHPHEDHEFAIYVLSGSSSSRHGPHLEQVDSVPAGDLVSIPAGMLHQPFDPTDRPTRALIARTDPNEQESAVLL